LAVEHPTSEVYAATRSGLRHRRARQGLRAAYERAGDGDLTGARRAAVRALHGSSRQIVRGAAMLVAPSQTVRRREERHADPRWVVDH
jgi:hypothetical protein